VAYDEANADNQNKNVATVWMGKL